MNMSMKIHRYINGEPVSASSLAQEHVITDGGAMQAIAAALSRVQGPERRPEAKLPGKDSLHHEQQ